MSPNTLLLRFEGPLQAWGDHQSKFLIRRTAEAPTKSGVAGMLCAALGIPRENAPAEWLPKLCALRMGVRLDSPGVRWWDYQTVGARMKMRTAEGKPKPGAMLTRREYLCDASFLVALQGEPKLIAVLQEALQKPKWTLYLGRKCCPPSRPLLERPAAGEFSDLLSALRSVAWQRRLKGDELPRTLNALLDWQPSDEQLEVPEDAVIWYDAPQSFDPPSHEPRFVVRRQFTVDGDGGVAIAIDPAQHETPAPSRPRTDYGRSTWGKIRDRRLEMDHDLCVFCKAPAVTGQHISYRYASRENNAAALADESVLREHLKGVRSLCRLCHDAVTMIEYGLGMGLDRINPEEPRWREMILRKRGEIVSFRSLETRRRRLTPGEVE